jgi:hypothetical protein
VVHERNQLVQHSTVALPQLLEQCGYGLRHRAIIPRRGGWGLGPGRPPPIHTQRAVYRKRGCVVEPTWICRALQRVLPLEDKRPHGDLHQAAVVPAGPAGLAVMVASPCPSPRPPAGGWDARRAEDRCIRIFAALRHADSSGAFPAVAKTHTLLLCSILNTPVRLI